MSQNPSPIRPSDVEKISSIGNENEEMAAPSTPFSSYMNPDQQSSAALAANSQASNIPSPFDLSQKAAGVLSTGPTNETLLSQVSQAQSTLGDINTQLNYPNLKLKASQKHLLNTKLNDASSLLRSANMRMGVDPGPSPDVSGANGPIGKFLSLLSDGSRQIASAKTHIENISKSGASINPADMLLIQIKLNKAQQELEFSSVLLSKAVDDLKQLMNTQI